MTGPIQLHELSIKPWTGVTAPVSDCEHCSWAWNGVCMEIKYFNRVCPEHGRLCGPARYELPRG